MTIDYAQRLVTLNGCPLQLTTIAYELLAELSSSAPRVAPYDRLLRRVWRNRRSRDSRYVRTIVKSLRRKLQDDANEPTFIFTEPRVGYRMPPGETRAGAE